MIKNTLLFLFILIFFPITFVYASGFNLKSIGGVDTDGKLYSSWYHTSLQPTFSGEAQANSEVNIKIDDQTYTASASGQGSWSWAPPSELSAGDHSVILTNQDSDISFTLTLGESNVNWDEVSVGGGETLPTVGIIEPTLVLIAGGCLFFLVKRVLFA